MKRAANLAVVHAVPASKIPTTAEGSFVTLRIETARIEPADEIRPIAEWAKAWTLELAGLRGAVTRAKIPTLKIGRSICVRRSDLLRIIDALFVEAASKPQASGDTATDYDSIVAQAQARRRR